MKRNSKLMLMATSLLTVSIAASATSAFAWYTANKVATVKMTQIDITTKTSSLKVEIEPSANPDFKEITYEVDEQKASHRGETPDNPFIVTNKQVGTYFSDVTSNGNGVYNKPKFNPTGDEIVGWYNETQAVKYAKSLNLKFTATGHSKLELYLSSTSVPSKLAQGKLSPAEEFRFSVTKGASPTTTYPVAGTDETVLLYANPYGTIEESKYLAGSELGSTAPGSPAAGTPISPDLIASNQNLFSVTNGSNEVTAYNQGTNNKAKDGYIAEIAAGGELYLKFNLWIEGTDPQCVIDEKAENAFEDMISQFKLNFYALEVAVA